MNDMGFARVLGRMAEERRPFSVATVVRISGSSLGKPGFKMVIDHDGRIAYGTLGGACPDGPIVQVAQEVMETGEPRLVRVYLEDVESAVKATVTSQSRDEIHVETNCGGMMEIYVEPYLPPDRLIVVGEGGRDPVEDQLVQLGRTLNFEVVVIDHKPVLSSEPDVLIDEVDFDLGRFEFGERDSVVLLTRGSHDVEYLKALSKVKVRYVGLMASRRRVEQTLKELREAGVNSSFLEELRAPIGVDIGAKTPSELVLSIMAEVVATRHGRRLPRKGEVTASKATAE
jgi:xanthine dehydrogenase accessory factor